jgi:putative ABC transport system permease protein
MMKGLFQDVPYAFRQLRKSPGFTAVVVLTLALGIGANTAIFSVIHAVLLRSLPYPDPGRLMILQEYATKDGYARSVSWMNYLDWRARNRSFSEMAAYNMRDFNLSGLEKPEVVHGARVTSPFFALTGATCVLGRAFSPEEDKPEANRTVALSYAFWRTHFGANSDVLGKTITLDGESYTILGVVRPDFGYFPRPISVYVPAALSAGPGSNWLQRGNHPGLQVLARLRPEASLHSARADVDVIMSALEKEFPDVNAGERANVTPVFASRYGDIKPVLLTLFGGVGCVLMIACANVANLALARAAARQREFSVRAAIGAGRLRIIRQLLTESILLALAGAALGLLLATWFLQPLVRLAPQGIPRLSDTAIDLPVFVFNFGIALLTGVLFGLAPAFQASRADLTVPLHEAAQASLGGVRGGRLRTGLLISEIAIAVVLVVFSGLLGRSLLKALAVDPGFRADHLLAIDVSLPEYRYKTDFEQKAFLDELLRRAQGLPGVESTSAVMCPPLVGSCWESIFLFDDRPVPPVAELPAATFNVVEPGYFRTINVPLIQGRPFNSSDTASSNRVVLINQTAARRWWPNQNPIGKRIKQGYPQDNAPFREIIGVVGDLKQSAPDQIESAEVFEPQAQNTMSSFTLMLRTAAEPMSLANDVERLIHSVDPDQPIYHVKAMTQYLSESLSQRKFATVLLALFGLLALLLAAVGNYGVISYLVEQRTREIGVRMALGAQRTEVQNMVVLRGARLAVIGVLLGIAMALLVTRALAGLLFGVGAADPWTFSAVTVLLIFVALFASYIPARRAAKVDPIIALRYE